MIETLSSMCTQAASRHNQGHKLVEMFRHGLEEGQPKEELYERLGAEFSRSPDTIRRHLQKAGALDRRKVEPKLDFDLSKCNGNAQEHFNSLVALVMSFGQNKWHEVTSKITSQLNEHEKRRALLFLRWKLRRVKYEYSKLRSVERILLASLKEPILLLEGQNHMEEKTGEADDDPYRECVRTARNSPRPSLRTTRERLE